MRLGGLHSFVSSGEVLKQYPVEEGVAAADLAEQDPLVGMIQELDVIPWCGTVADQPETKDEMLEARPTSNLQLQGSLACSGGIWGCDRRMRT